MTQSSPDAKPTDMYPLALCAKIRQRWPDRVLQREAIRKMVRQLRELIK